jgi:AcrR family transcriptional regulator
VAKPLISAETIYDKALRVLEAEGVKGLTARNLASRLRCSAKTLYQQVGNREALIRGLVAHFWRRKHGQRGAAVQAAASSRWAKRSRAAASRVGMCSLGQPSTGAYRFSSDLAMVTLCTSFAPSTRLAIRAMRYIDSSGMSAL